MFRNGFVLVVATSLVACGPSRQRLDGAKRAASLSDGELKGLVDRLFVDEDPNRENFHTLMAAGRRADRFLIEALDEPRTQTAVFVRKNFDFTGNSPFHRICDLLAHTAPPEAVKSLAKYLHHPNREFRQDAALVLGRIGTAECLEPMKVALEDPEHRVREYALMGIAGGLRERRRDEKFLSGVYEAVAPRLKDAEYDGTGPAAVLAAIDLDKAAPLLESAEYFTTRNPQLEDVLKALNSDRHKTPHAILMPLLKELAPAADGGRRGLEFAAALRLYARNPDAEAEGTFRALLDAASEPVAMGAAGGLEILAGIDSDAAVTAGDHGEFATMTVPQRMYYAVTIYNYEVCNGGHDQYFRNSSGDIYPTALEGLKAIGAGTKAAILESALIAFPGGHPSTDRGARQLQLDTLPDALLGAADQQYYASEKKPKERIEVLLTLFALKYRTHFTRPPGKGTN